MSNAEPLQDFIPTRIEFRDPVFIGFGPYAAQVYLRHDKNLPPTSPVAKSHSTNAHGWWLILQSGVCVLVPHANVRFVVYEKAPQSANIPVIGSNSSAAQVHGEKQPESVGSDGQAESGAEPPIAQEVVDKGKEVHSAEHTETSPAPKKRGRPPKAWSTT